MKETDADTAPSNPSEGRTAAGHDDAPSLSTSSGRQRHIRQLIESSSLGTPAARELRGSVDASAARFVSELAKWRYRVATHDVAVLTPSEVNELIELAAQCRLRRQRWAAAQVHGILAAWYLDQGADDLLSVEQRSTATQWRQRAELQRDEARAEIEPLDGSAQSGMAQSLGRSDRGRRIQAQVQRSTAKTDSGGVDPVDHSRSRPAVGKGWMSHATLQQEPDGGWIVRGRDIQGRPVEVRARYYHEAVNWARKLVPNEASASTPPDMERS